MEQEAKSAQATSVTASQSNANREPSSHMPSKLPDSEPSVIIGGETPASISSKASQPVKHPQQKYDEDRQKMQERQQRTRQQPVDDPETKKMEELRRIRQEAKAAEIQRQQSHQQEPQSHVRRAEEEDDSPWLRNQMSKLNEPQIRQAPLPLVQQQPPPKQRLFPDSESDSEQENHAPA